MFQEHVEFAKALVEHFEQLNEYTGTYQCVFCGLNAPEWAQADRRVAPGYFHREGCVVPKAQRVLRISKLPADEYTGHRREDPYAPDVLERAWRKTFNEFTTGGSVHVDSDGNCSNES